VDVVDIVVALSYAVVVHGKFTYRVTYSSEMLSFERPYFISINKKRYNSDVRNK